MKVCVWSLSSPEAQATAQGKARGAPGSHGPTQPAARPRGKAGSCGGSAPPVPGEVSGHPSSCRCPPGRRTCALGHLGGLLHREAESQLPGRMLQVEKFICPAVLRSFGPVLLCPCCPRGCSLLSQHEGASEELINFPFQGDIFRELRHIRMYGHGTQWNFTGSKLRHTQTDSESLLQVLTLT